MIGLAVAAATAGLIQLISGPGSAGAQGAEPPETTILAGPSGPTRDSRPVFSFEFPAGGASFECSLGGVTAGFAQCSGPESTDQPAEPLADGPYVFAVRAVVDDLADPTPATRRFRVDTQAGLRIASRHLVLSRSGRISARIACPAFERPGPAVVRSESGWAAPVRGWRASACGSPLAEPG